MSFWLKTFVVVAVLTLFQSSEAAKPLPVFFFHGVTSNGMSAINYIRNLTTEGRIFVPLDFCPNACSVRGLNTQVQMAITQVRQIAQAPAFQNGYIFIGHSQGAAIARAVIEEMDDHNVRMFISLAGAVNGIFYGPQPSDTIPLLAFQARLGPAMIPHSLFNFAKYTPINLTSGQFQYDFNEFVMNHPELQEQLSVVNLGRSPVIEPWSRINTFLPVINNINPCDGNAQCEKEKERRRQNFLKLTSAHFFGSPQDDVIAPWQSSILGQYADVVSAEDLLTNFQLFPIMDVKITREYTEDTYGLRTLDSQGGLFTYVVPNVGHSCWLVNSVPLGTRQMCYFQPVYDNYIYPLLQTDGWGYV